MVDFVTVFVVTVFVVTVFVVLGAAGFTPGFVLAAVVDDETALADVLDLEIPTVVVVVLAEPVGRVVLVVDFPDVGRAGDPLVVVLVVVAGLLVAPVVQVVEVAGDLEAVDLEAVGFVGDVFAAGLVPPDR